MEKFKTLLIMQVFFITQPNIDDSPPEHPDMHNNKSPIILWSFDDFPVT